MITFFAWTRRRPGWVISAALSFVLLGGALPLRAQTLEVTPVRIEMPPGQLTTTLTVTNKGTEPTAVQVRAFTWAQPKNEDELKPTSDVVLSPPIAELPPGETQLIRILVRSRPLEKEVTYRLLVDQIPPPENAGTVRIALRLSLPVFVAPARPVAAQVDWRVLSKDGKAFELVASNRGGRHIRLSDIAVKGPGGTSLALPGNENPYVLSGAERRWPLIGKSGALNTGAVLHLTASSNGGSIEAAPVLAAAP